MLHGAFGDIREAEDQSNSTSLSLYDFGFIIPLQFPNLYNERVNIFGVLNPLVF